MRSSAFIVLVLALSAAVHADPLTSLETFISATFAAFDLSDISDIMACYNESTAQTQLLTIAAVYPWSVAFGATAQNTFANLSNYLSDLDSDMEPVWNCATEASEFENLLIALNATQTIHNAIWPNFFDAHARDFALKYAAGYAYFVAQNYAQAGAALVPILQQGAVNASQINSTNFYGFANGLFWSWNISLPADSVYCFNSNSINQFLNLLDLWFQALFTSNSGNAYSASTQFYQSNQAAITSLLNSVQSCVVGSNDHTRVTNKLGVDLNSAQYRQAFESYMQNSEATYFNQSFVAGEYFVSNQVFEAGQLVGQLLNFVADTISDEISA